MTNADSIIESLDNHRDEWDATHTVLSHNRSGVKLWIENGPLFLKDAADGQRLQIGIWGKIKVWLAYRRWNRWNVERRLAPPAPKWSPGNGAVEQTA